MKKLVLFMLYTFLSVILLEVFLKFSQTTPPPIKYYDKVYGSLNRPNMDYFKSVEGYFIGRTNSDGRFGENYTKRKGDPKALRILLIGDSFVEGIDVFSKNHFARHIERNLSKKLERKVEIVNFGRGNCTLHASSYYFKNYIEQNYDADIVLYFTEARDAQDSNDYPSTGYTLDDSDIPQLIARFHWRSSPDYILHNKLSSIPVLAMYDSSSFFRLLYRARSGTKIIGFPVITLGKFYGPRPEQDYQLVSNEGSVVSALTRRVYDLVYRYDKGQVIFVVRNMPIKAQNIIDHMNLEGYSHIDLDDAFDGYNIRNTSVNAYYFKASMAYGGHWNNDGHKAVGEYLSKSILENIDSYTMPHYER
jgi:hypothetical protein